MVKWSYRYRKTTEERQLNIETFHSSLFVKSIKSQSRFIQICVEFLYHYCRRHSDIANAFFMISIILTQIHSHESLLQECTKKIFS